MNRDAVFSDRPRTSFACLFAMLTITIYALLQTAPEIFFTRVNEWNALATGFFLQLLGMAPRVNGDLVSMNGFSAKVVGECSAVFISILPLSFFLAYPAPVKFRIAGLAIGLPVLFFFNILRIVFIFIVGLKIPALFSWIHLYIGQVLMILAVIWICMAWLHWISNQRAQPSVCRFVFKVFCFSILPFIIWIWLSKPYTRAILFLADKILNSFGFRVALPESLAIYPHTFISFNIVIMFSLVLAERILKDRRQLFKTAAGFIGLVGLHTLFQALPLLFFQHHMVQTTWMINALLVTHQFVLPFILWLIFIPIPAKPLSTGETCTGSRPMKFEAQ